MERQSRRDTKPEMAKIGMKGFQEFMVKPDRLDKILERIENGQGRDADIDLLKNVADNIEGNTICALGDAAAWPVQSFLKHYRHEFEYMVRNQGRSIVDAAPGEAA